MIRFAFSTIALLLMLMPAGCVTHRIDTARSEYQHTETTHTQEGNADGAELKSGEHTRQRETIQTREESTTTKRSE